MSKYGASKLKFVIVPTLIAIFFTLLSVEAIQYTNSRVDQFALRTEAEAAATAIENDVERGVLALRAFEAFQAALDRPINEEDFGAFARNLHPTLSGFATLVWIDQSGTVRHVYPAADGAAFAGYRFGAAEPFRTALEKAGQYRLAAVSAPTMTAAGYPGAAVFMPMFKNGEYQGAVGGVMNFEHLFGSAAGAVNLKSHGAIIKIDSRILTLDGRTIYAADDPAAPKVPAADEVLTLAIPVADALWNLTAYRLNGAFTRATLPFTLLGVFFILSIYIFLLALYRQRVVTETALAREREFVALVSHQLRTPLTELSWALDTSFEDVHALPKDRADTIKEMKQIVKNSAKLITDLLNFSRVERGVLSIKCEDVAPAKLVSDVLIPLHEEARRKGIRFKIDVRSKTTLFTDPLKAAEAVRNVVDNAVKYGPARSEVELSVTEDEKGSYAVFTIRDHGQGIPEEARRHLFEKSTALARKSATGEGAGLGLFLAKEFIELLGGKIRFETSSSGTTFYVSLPFKKPPKCDLPPKDAAL